MSILIPKLGMIPMQDSQNSPRAESAGLDQDWRLASRSQQAPVLVMLVRE